MSLQASVPKFDRIPWLCEASLRNKPLVLSLPQRYPHGSATSLNSWRKDVNSPNTFQVPNGLSKGPGVTTSRSSGRRRLLCRVMVCGSQDPPPHCLCLLGACLRTLPSVGMKEARRNQRGPMLGRNQQLCSTCQEVRMVQPRMMMIPNDLKHSFENCMSHRMKSLQPPKAQTEPRCSPDDISTESIHYRLPLLGPRAGAFHELLSDSYKALRGIQLSASPRKEPTGKTVRQ